MGKRGPPYKLPDDAQWIVVLQPPHTIQQDGQISYIPLEYWLRALFGDQRAARFIFEVLGPPRAAVIVELPSPEELPIPKAMYGEHNLRNGLKRRPWFTHDTGFTTILPYNFEQVGHPEDTRKISPMICGACEDEWLKIDLTIPYPLPERPFDFSCVPQRARMYCRRPPDGTPPPPDPMEIERYLTPPAQQRQRTQPPPRTSQPGTDKPLFLPEDDSKPKIKNLDPYQEDSVESISRNINPNQRELNALVSRANDEPDDRLTAKREFANQDDIGSRKRFEVLNAVYRSQSPSPEDDDPLAVKRELENQDGPGAQEMFEVLNAVNRGQSTPGDEPSSGKIKRDLEDVGLFNQPSSSGSLSRAPNQGRDPSSLNSWHDRDERGGHEWRDGERGREPGDRKRPFGHHDRRGREDRGSDNRGEYKRSRANYN